MVIAESGALYVDSSSLLTWILLQPGGDVVQARISTWHPEREVVSSRLLELEIRRTLIREERLGGQPPPGVQDILNVVRLLPISEQVWDRAASIEQHLRALDAIHLATCELIGATLLTAGLDRTIASVAVTRGIPTT